MTSRRYFGLSCTLQARYKQAVATNCKKQVTIHVSQRALLRHTVLLDNAGESERCTDALVSADVVQQHVPLT